VTRLQIGRDLVLGEPALQLVATDGSDEEDLGVAIEVTNEDQGQAGLILDEDDVRQLRDYLSQWLDEAEASR
jgi:hypothetical protein